MVYQISTKVTSAEDSNGSSYKVTRQYSEILNLYNRLLKDYHQDGIIIPPPPEKNRLAAVALKMSNNPDLESSIASHVFEKRCLALDRYLKRLAKHPIIRKDAIFRAFIQEKDLPKSLNKSKSLNEKMLDIKERLNRFRTKFTVTEHDPWFQTRHAQLNTLAKQVEEMQSNLKDMAKLKTKLYYQYF